MVELKEGQLLARRFTLERRLSTAPASQSASGHPPTTEVWLARDAQAGDIRVALKIIPLEATRSAALLEHEFVSAGRVRHDAILPAVGLFEHDQLRLLAMHYAEGGSLAALAGQPAERFLPMLLPVIDALCSVHERGLVHRDVKPPNILLSQGRAMLADFGIASALDPAAAGHVSSGGSPFSMSPQQYRQQPPSAADDIYGLGATLYEMITGQPPFYPDFSAQRLLEQAPAPIPEQAGCPRQLAALTMRMLAKQPSERPSSMREIHRELSQLVATLANTTEAPQLAGMALAPGTAGEQFESLEALSPRMWQAHDTDGTRAAGGARAGVQLSPLSIGVASAVLVLLAGVMFVFLPRLIGPAQVSLAPVPSTPRSAAPDDQVIGPYEFARLARDRDEVRTLIDGLLVLQTDLELRRVDLWGAERYAELVELASAGDEQFKAQLFDDALASYDEALKIAEALLPLADTAYEAKMSEGWEAYEAGDAGRAIEAFSLALEMNPDNALAEQAYERAQNLPEIQQLLAQGRTLEEQGQLSDASRVYRRATLLDAERDEASAALARINARVSRGQFDSAMSQGFAAMQAGNYDAARIEFNRARSLQPNSKAPVDALLQLDNVASLTRMQAARSAAASLEARERWAEAIAAYQKILESDSSLAFAQEGLSRSRQMQALHKELDELLADPLRLSADSVYRRSGELLGQAPNLPQGEEFAGKLAQLARLRAVARIPIKVRLRSDNMTEVTLYRSGPLGRFDEREIELRPGAYTAVGTRPGYRDVRREFRVIAGENTGPIEIRCEERI